MEVRQSAGRCRLVASAAPSESQAKASFAAHIGSDLQWRRCSLLPKFSLPFPFLQETTDDDGDILFEEQLKVPARFEDLACTSQQCVGKGNVNDSIAFACVRRGGTGIGASSSNQAPQAAPQQNCQKK